LTDLDASTARIWIAKDIALDAASGREKHTDPVNQVLASCSMTWR